MATPGNDLSSRVELRLSCSNLRDADFLSKSDPLVVIYVKSGDHWTEYARTEHIKNNLNPVFTKSVEIVYYFEEIQKLRFVVYDLDNETTTLEDDDLLGSVECTLGEIVSAGVFTKPLQYKEHQIGAITIHVEEISGNNNRLDIKFFGRGLDKKDFLGKSDPYLEFAKMNSDGSFSVVYRTDFIKNTLNPDWPKFSIDSKDLCSNNLERNIKVTCYDWDADGSHDLIGSFTTNLLELSTAYEKNEKCQWELINPKKKTKKSYKNSGTIYLDFIAITRLHSFLDYIIGGCSINFTVGIDFTASNGDPKQPSSLHYIDPYSPNEYMTALRAVGLVCQDYDSDKLFPAFGFGGEINGEVSHEFALNGNPQNPYCAGVEGIIAAYQQALLSVELFAPTNMAPIINHVAKFAEAADSNKDRQDYFILLILTDGEITDMPDTKRAIIRASHLPMSIIIVGVGSCSFVKMVELDADEKRLTQGSAVAERDIVQFVPYRKYSKVPPNKLAEVVLGEIPQQLTEYMFNKGRVPMSRK